MASQLFDRKTTKRDAINILAIGIAFTVIGGELLRWWHSSTSNVCVSADDPHGDRRYSYPSECYEDSKVLFAAALICFIVGGLEVLQGLIHLLYCYTGSLVRTYCCIFLLSVFCTLLCLLLLDYVALVVICTLLIYGFYPLAWTAFWVVIAVLFVRWTWT
ncbi:uncharacterized protein BJX67DRAFT_382178 [Aspergillus lucknowensis]|uniref:Uncharacterized protein n=1 Tax=Aspergillus lucknowensis TaxID=176173 RepID=A0ABR4LNG5_9EURO